MPNPPRPNLPPYNTARGDSIEDQPGPFDFEGTTIRVFPLRADQARLESFCAEYLDLTPDIATFEVAAPYVFLIAINYGKMSSEAHDVGWWSQNEVFFAVPLDWYNPENGEDRFHDWAVLTPYIFVDNAVSIATGREVYGWPKARAWLRPRVDSWMTHPRDPRVVLDLQAHTLSKLIDDQRPAIRTIVEIEHEPPLSVAQVPLDPRANPLFAIPNAVIGSLRGMSTVANMLSDLLGADSSEVREDKLHLLFHRLIEDANFSPRDLIVHAINMKQFRDVQSPNHACYQAVTVFPLQVVRINGGGLLGNTDMLTGDITGGYTIKLSEYPDLPVVRTLGLEVADHEETEDGHVAILKPRLPLWIDADIRNSLADNLCWRGENEKWTKGDPGVNGETPPELRSAPTPTQKTNRRPVYNSTRGAALQTGPGPYEFPAATFRVFPLQADQQKLQDFCENYFGDVPKDVAHFDTFCSTIFLVAANYGRIPPDVSRIGLWGGNEVSFIVPVAWYRDGNLVSYGMFTPYIFADSTTSVATGREVYGWPMTFCLFESQFDAWMNEDGPNNPRRVLSLKTSVFDKVHADRRPDPAVLIEIEQLQHTARAIQTATEQPGKETHAVLHSSLTSIAAEVKQHLHGALSDVPGSEQILQTLKSIPPEKLWQSKLFSKQPVNFLNLKQFRDAPHPMLACYQALVYAQTSVCAYKAFSLDPHPSNAQSGESSAFEIKIHNYPNQPIVEQLGLVPKPGAVSTEGVTTLEPIAPFWIQADVTYNAGKRLCWRAGTTTWSTPSEQSPVVPEGRLDIESFLRHLQSIKTE